ncbi:MAG: GumC family protein [Vicinamibacteraceae bacterium]
MDSDTTIHRSSFDAVGQRAMNGEDSRATHDGATSMALRPDVGRLALPEDLTDWVRFVRRHWLLMLIVWAVVMALVGTALYFWPRSYQSTAKFLVKNARHELVVGPSDTGTPVYGQQSAEVVMQTELELLRSWGVMARVVEELRLDQPLIDQGEDLAVAKEQAVRGLWGGVAAEALRKTNIIQVSYMSQDAERAAAIVQHVADAYLAAHLAMHSTPGTYEMFRRQNEDVSVDLQGAETELAALARNSNLVDLEAQKAEALTAVQATEAELRSLAAQTEEQRSRVRVADVQLDKTPERVPTTVRNIPQVRLVESLHAKLVDLRNERTELLMKFNANDRFVQQVDQKIADTKAALEGALTMEASEQSTGINPTWQQLQTERTEARLQLAGLESKAAKLERELGAQRTRLVDLTEAGPRYDQLVRRVADLKNKYDLFAKRQEEARVADVLDKQRIANVVLAQAPMVSHIPASPNIRMGAVAGAILAALLAGCAAIARELLAFHLASRRVPSTGRSILGIPPTAVESREPLRT